MYEILFFISTYKILNIYCVVIRDIMGSLKYKINVYLYLPITYENHSNKTFMIFIGFFEM